MKAPNASAARSMAETILTGKSACQGCVIACGREVTINEGPYATDGQVKGPEYETIASFGSQLLVDDLPIITALGNRCDAVGVDTISAGNTIALAYLMFDRGIISAADTGGLELRWGDARPCFDLIEQIARREGFGALLAQGSQALAAHYGVEELAVHVNNLEVPMHDPRAMTGQALAYVTSPRGACHNQSDYFLVEMGNSIDDLGIPMTERLEDGGKAHHVARHQDWRTVCNSLVTCFFAATPPSTYVKLLSAATGHDWSLEEMMRAGERAWNLKRAYNCRLGLTRATEKLPKLLLEPLPDGGQAGHVPDMELMLNEYYAARGWDEATGLPTPQKLAELGLNFALNLECQMEAGSQRSEHSPTLPISDLRVLVSNLESQTKPQSKMILVTGATGFLGHNLIPLLIERGHRVRALVRPTSDYHFLRECGAELAFGDTRDARARYRRSRRLRGRHSCSGQVSLLGQVRSLCRHQRLWNASMSWKQRDVQVCSDSSTSRPLPSSATPSPARSSRRKHPASRRTLISVPSMKANGWRWRITPIVDCPSSSCAPARSMARGDAMPSTGCSLKTRSRGCPCEFTTGGTSRFRSSCLICAA